MIEDIASLSVEELQCGYRFLKESGEYVCCVCGRRFAMGEVFPMGDNRFYEAGRAIELHVAGHGSLLDNLLSTESKYLTLTENQRELFSMMGRGLSDAEIARQMDISPSTVRHQRFLFRERAKQARIYLAAYGLAMERVGRPQEEMIEVHSAAKMLDERFVITRAEEEKILSLAFSSLEPLRLKHFPPKEKKKIVILNRIAQQFERGRRYTEKEVNAILGGIFDDYVTLRRYLIEYGYMDRTTDCAEYWKKEE